MGLVDLKIQCQIHSLVGRSAYWMYFTWCWASGQISCRTGEDRQQRRLVISVCEPWHSSSSARSIVCEVDDRNECTSLGVVLPLRLPIPLILQDFNRESKQSGPVVTPLETNSVMHLFRSLCESLCFPELPPQGSKVKV